MATEGDREGSGTAGEADRTADQGGEAIEERVRRVQHLDPFTLTCHPDGRFEAELTRPPGQLDPSAAREVLREMEALVETLRRRIGDRRR